MISVRHNKEHADCINTNVRLPFVLLSLMFCHHLTLVSEMPTQ